MKKKKEKNKSSYVICHKNNTLGEQAVVVSGNHCTVELWDCKQATHPEMKISWELCCFKETKLSFSKAWCDRPMHLNRMEWERTEPVLLLKSCNVGTVGCTVLHQSILKAAVQVRSLLGVLQKQWLIYWDVSFCLKGSTSTSDQLLPFLLALWCQICQQHVWKQTEALHIYRTTYLHKFALSVAAYDKLCRTWDTCVG